MSSGLVKTRTRDTREQPFAHARVDRHSVPSVERFLDELTELPVGELLAMGRSFAEDRDRRPSWQLACDALRAVVCDDELCFGAWRVCDGVQTCAFLAYRSRRHWSCRDRGILASGCQAATWAALALLAHPYLTLEHFSTLYGAFAQCFPFSRGLVRSA